MKPKPLSPNALRTLRLLRSTRASGGDGNLFYGRGAIMQRGPAFTRGIAELVRRHVLYLDYEVCRESVRGSKVET